MLLKRSKVANQILKRHMSSQSCKNYIYTYKTTKKQQQLQKNNGFYNTSRPQTCLILWVLLTAGRCIANFGSKLPCQSHHCHAGSQIGSPSDIGKKSELYNTIY